MPEIAWPQFAAGLALCLGGWTFYWVGLHLTGALVGGGLGVALVWGGAELAELDVKQIWWPLPLGGVTGFVAGMFLMRGLHRFLFFFVGATLGLAAGQAAFVWVGEREAWAAQNPDLWRGVFVLVGSVLGGMLMLRGSRWAVALVTSIAGSFLAALAVDDPLALMALVPLIPSSFLLQIGMLRSVGGMRHGGARRRDDEYDEEEE